MAEKSGSEAGVSMAPFDFGAVIEMQRPAFTAMADLNTKLYEGIASVNKEWASFVNRRLQDDLAAQQQLAECKSVQDLYRVYAQFFQNACSHYQSGLEQMTKLGRSLVENALQPLQSTFEEASRAKH
jgi:hypothetical protein